MRMQAGRKVGCHCNTAKEKRKHLFELANALLRSAEFTLLCPFPHIHTHTHVEQLMCVTTHFDHAARLEHNWNRRRLA